MKKLRITSILLLIMSLLVAVSCNDDTPAPTPVESVTITQGESISINLAVEKTAQLTVNVDPEDAADKNITWTTSDDTVATVADGLVTALKEGSAVITAASVSNPDKSAAITVTVHNTVYVESVVIENGESAKVALNGTLELQAKVLPVNATDQGITWSSENTDVAEVSVEGIVTAKSAGTTKITATSNGNQNASADIEVEVYVPVTSITLSGAENNSTIFIGEEVNLTAAVEPTESTYKDLIWSTTDETIATVENGVVTPATQGSVTITAASVSDPSVKASITFTVDKKIETFEINAVDSLRTTLFPTSTLKLDVTFGPSDVNNKEIIWESSDDTVATVDGNGNVTAVKSSTEPVKITATSVLDSTKTASIDLTVSNDVTVGQVLTLDGYDVTVFEATTEYTDLAENRYKGMAVINSTEYERAGINKKLLWSNNTEAQATMRKAHVTAGILNSDIDNNGCNKDALFEGNDTSLSMWSVLVDFRNKIDEINRTKWFIPSRQEMVVILNKYLDNEITQTYPLDTGYNSSSEESERNPHQCKVAIIYTGAESASFYRSTKAGERSVVFCRALELIE